MKKMILSFELLLNWGSKVMKSDEGFSNMLDKSILIDYQYENVIRFHLENTLKTYTKQN